MRSSNSARQKFAMLSHKRVSGLAAQNVDGSRLNVVRLWRIAKQWPHVGVGHRLAEFFRLLGVMKGDQGLAGAAPSAQRSAWPALAVMCGTWNKKGVPSA